MRVVIDGIPVRVSWKHNKHMYLYISPTEGVACVTAPIGAPMQRIERFVRKKRDWIEKQQKKYRESKLRQEKLQEKMKAAQVDVGTYLREEIAELLPKWEERTGLHCSGFQIRDMKTRWGSCNTRTGKLWFSLMLAWQPRECVEYVILHEFLHLRYPDHGAAFHAALDRMMPDNRARRALLRTGDWKNPDSVVK